MLMDHIAKLSNLVVLCVVAIRLNGERPIDLCMDVNSVTPALAYQRKTQFAEQCFKIPERDRSVTCQNLFKGFLRPGHTD